MSETVFLLEGLCCANCAAKIEARAKKLDGVAESMLNFVSQELKLIFDASITDEDELFGYTMAIVKRLEPGVAVSKKQQGHKTKNSRGCCSGDSEASFSHEKSHKHDHGGSCGCESGHAEHGHEHKERSDAHGHSHEDGDFGKAELVTSLIGVAVYICAFVFGGANETLRLALFLAAYIFLGWNVVLAAIKNICAGELFDENFLMSVSTVGAFFIREYPEAVAVMLFYKIGEYLQSKAVGRSRKSVRALMELKPEYANISVNGELVKVDPSDVGIGEIITVLPGEKVPLDGTVVSGDSQTDAASLTGESVPVAVAEGSEVLSGVININGILKIKTSKLYSDSTVARILELVENASSKKAPTEKFITKFSKIYTPAVVAAAILLAVVPPLLLGWSEFYSWLKSALVFLVVSCPCALVISIPLSFFSGIGTASKKGILIKGGNSLQELANVDTVVFDKTGTLTEGVFEVKEIIPAKGISEERILETAYCAEQFSTHPIAKAVSAEVKKRGAGGAKTAADVKETAGHGIRAVADGKSICCGNARLMKAEGITVPEYSGEGSVLYVSEQGKYLGCVIIADKIKPDSVKAISELKKLGIRRTVMLTGDRRATAEEVAKKTGVDEFYCELLPDQKVEMLEKLYGAGEKTKIAFAGDGINDAPVLARSDVGFAMGGLGSDAAIEAADIVIMNDEPAKIGEAVKVSRKTMAIVKQNITIALFFKFAVLLLSVLRLSSLWMAVFADVGVCLIVIFNSMRVNEKVRRQRPV